MLAPYCHLGTPTSYRPRHAVGGVQSRVCSLSVGVKVTMGLSRVVVSVSEW